jgi:hypothetical protein
MKKKVEELINSKLNKIDKKEIINKILPKCEQ